MKYSVYDASSAQKRLYLINQLQGNSVLYNMPFAWIIDGNLDPFLMEAAMKRMIQRHETLRTCFAARDGEVFQKVYDTLESRLTYCEIEKYSTGGIASILNDFIKPFDLDNVPLWRLKLMQSGPGTQFLLFDIHHSVCDGTSIDLLLRDLMTFYSGGELPELAFRYVDYTAWQNEQWHTGWIKRQEQYWLNVFAGEIPVLDFPSDYPRPMETDIAGTGIEFKISEELTSKMNQLASGNNTTLYVVLLAVYNVLLWKYTNQDDIVVGSTVSGRTRLEFENIIGMFVNTLALRNKVNPNNTFKEFLLEVSKNTFIAFDNQDYPFEMLVEKVAPQRHLNRNPLFDTILVLQNYYRPMEIPDRHNGHKGLVLTPYRYKARVSKFDLTLEVSEADRHIIILIVYRTSLFHKDMIRGFIEHFINIVREVVTDCHLRLSEVRVISEAEKEHLIYALNDTAADFPLNKIIHALFEEQAERTPDSVAVIGIEQLQITYRELNEKSDRLAHLLIKKGVKPDTIVAIMIEPSLEMIIGILGILKAGGAYLPIDPDYPEERKQYMLADSGARILLTNLSEGHHFYHSSFITHHSGNLAYVIYTSGTTGRPKGVMVDHRGVVNMLEYRKHEYRMDANMTSLQLFSYSFDGFVTSFFTPVISGARVVLPGGKERMDTATITEMIVTHRVTHFICVPQLYQAIIENMTGTAAAGLKVVTLAGDKLSADILDITRQKNRNIEVINEYGITEGSVMSTLFRHQEQEAEIKIGNPIWNTKVFILDNQLRPQPIRIPGEIYIGGEGVVRGYLNKPELTGERFIDYRSYRTYRTYISSKKLYKTGDRGRWLPDGNIEFLGRIDHQVKLRGFRVELHEIESQLENHPAVKEAVVTVREDKTGDKQLCAYAVYRKSTEITSLREFLARILPGYMIPACFVTLDKMPLTANGKVDRKALPDPGLEGRSEYIAPRDEVEKKLVEIWREVLGLGDDTSIGIEDNFFDLGGHSLKATILAAKIYKELGMKIPLTEIFKSPTIRGLSKNIADAAESTYIPPESAEKREYYPLSSLQKRFYILSQMKGIRTSYNFVNVMTVEGMLRRGCMEEAFQLLIQRHESLRTSFELREGEVVQRTRPAAEIDFSVEFHEKYESEPFRDEEIQQIIKAFIKPFDLSQPPLLRAELVKLSNREHLLIFDMHHIISDGTSMGILVRELVSFYQGKKISLLRLQYKDFCQWQNSDEGQALIKQQEDYWLDLFKKEIPQLALFTDYERPAVQSFAGEAIYFNLEKEITEKIDRLKQETGATLYMILLAVYNILLSKYSGQEDIVVGTPIAGRQHTDFENIIGLFINALAMRNFPGADKTFLQFLKEVKENTLQAYQNQQYPFGHLLEKLGRMKAVSRNPLFDVELAVQNMETPEVRLEGLRLAPYKSYASQISQVDVALYAAEAEDGGIIYANMLYCSALFKRETIERFIASFKEILSTVLENRNLQLRDIHIVHDFAVAEPSAYQSESVDFDF